MNKEEGTELARTEVTKAIIGYIQEHKLQNNENRRVIMPDETLKTLLGVKDAEELNYFNLQKYMNKHFISKKSKYYKNNTNKLAMAAGESLVFRSLLSKKYLDNRKNKEYKGNGLSCIKKEKNHVEVNHFKKLLKNFYLAIYRNAFNIIN